MKLNKLTAILCLFVCALLVIIGCEDKPKVTTPAPSVNVSLAGTTAHAEDATKDLRSSTTKIASHVESAQSKTPPPVLPVLKPDYDAILAQTVEQGEIAIQLDGVTAELKTAQQLAVENDAAWQKKFNAQVGDTKTANARADAAEAQQNDWSAWLGRVGGGLITACGVAAFFFGGTLSKRIGLAVIPAGITLLVLSIVTPDLVRSSRWAIPIIIGALVLLVVAAVVYELYIHRNAVTDLVKTGEATKAVMTDAQRKAIYGNGPIPGVAYQLQSTATEGIVSAVRSTLPNLAAPAVPTPAVPATIPAVVTA